MKRFKKQIRNSLFVLISLPSVLLAIEATGGSYDLTKTFIGGTGYGLVTSADYSDAYAIGEDVAGTLSTSADYDTVTGYFSGYASGAIGPFNLITATIGNTKIFQDGTQVGVPLNAQVQMQFSSALDPSTVNNGIQVFMVMDHLGQPQDVLLTSSFSYTVGSTTLTVSSQGLWPGNSLLDIVATTQLQSVDGFVMPQAVHTRFITILDPQQENVVLNPIPVPGGAGAEGNTPSLNIDIPVNSFTGYSYVLVSQDPLHYPLQVDPAVLQAATQKANAAGGAYETPLLYDEIAAFSQQGLPVSISKAATISITSIGAGLVGNSQVPVRIGTLSLWKLDSVHTLWVKMPDSRPNGGGVAGDVTQFSVYSLMGSAEGDASAVYLFPQPWRPHGPSAGDGPGQSGSDSGGIIFNNLPSECDIKVYTVSGDLVWSVHHSDLTDPVGQQKWDVNTSGGNHAASGVYLWRVASSSDSKNGKLVVIR